MVISFLDVNLLSRWEISVCKCSLLDALPCACPVLFLPPPGRPLRLTTGCHRDFFQNAGIPPPPGRPLRLTAGCHRDLFQNAEGLPLLRLRNRCLSVKCAGTFTIH
jgi:hypothetical protein